MNKKIVSGIVIGLILLITIIFLISLIINKKNEQIKNNQPSEEMKQALENIAARKRSTAPQGFLVPNVGIIADCNLQSSSFEEKFTEYNYTCQIDKTYPPNLSYREQFGKKIDEVVKMETESKTGEIKKVDEFMYLDSKVVILGNFVTSSDGKISRPLEYRLHWMHGNNLVTIYTGYPEIISKDNLIELLKSLT
jgi:hypothetical protein